MKAIVQSKRGKEFSSMSVQEIKSPTISSNEVKIKMKSSRINPVDMDLMKGFPSLKYKKPQIGGVDGAGEIIEIASDVKGLEIGDNVFFYRMFSDIGSWAEEITIDASHVAKCPKNLSLEDSGAIALPLLTAYEALMELDPKTGNKILIHGAGGGVGFQAVQLSKALGLNIIANASDSDKEDLEKVGIDRFINYKKEDFSELLKDEKIDYIFDVIGGKNLEKSIKLKPNKVVSTSLADVNKMYKTGIKLPSLLKVLMKMMTKKFFKLSKQLGVEIHGQVTGANGNNLNEAALIVNNSEYKIRDYKTLSINEIQENGLSKSDIGKVIIF